MNILIGSGYLPDKNKPFHKFSFNIIKIIILVLEIKIKEDNIQKRIKP